MDFLKQIASFNIIVKDDPKIKIPKIGDKVIISNSAYKGMSHKEIIKLSKLPYLTVSDVLPIPIGEEGNYTWRYEIYVKESKYLIGINYKIL